MLTKKTGATSSKFNKFSKFHHLDHVTCHGRRNFPFRSVLFVPKYVGKNNQKGSRNPLADSGNLFQSTQMPFLTFPSQPA